MIIAYLLKSTHDSPDHPGETVELLATYPILGR